MKKEVNQDIISLLKKQLKKDNSQTIAEITKNMKTEGIKISRETVRKNIKKLGYESKVPIEGHILTDEQKVKRLNSVKSSKIKQTGIRYTLQMKRYSSVAPLENADD